MRKHRAVSYARNSSSPKRWSSGASQDATSISREYADNVGQKSSKSPARSTSSHPALVLEANQREKMKGLKRHGSMPKSMNSGDFWVAAVWLGSGARSYVTGTEVIMDG